MRQVPDHQECWHDVDDGGRLLVFEILQRQDQVADEVAALYFFQDLAESNECDAANRSFTPAPQVVRAAGAGVIPGLPAEATLCLGSGYQRVAMGRDFDAGGNPRRQQEVRIIHVDLCVIRLPRQSTDLLITLSTPVGEPNPQQGEQAAAVSEPFRQILSTFQIRDWSLFAA